MICPHCGSVAPEDARFCPACGTELGEASLHEERKVVSILFVDIVGSTAHAERSDPEDVRTRNQRYYTETRERIERYGGVVEKYIGDAVMAVFGAPLARSDDAERAVRAALSVLDGVRLLNERHPDLGLEVRVGVCSGEAMVAIDATPGDALATGDVVNTASRLQSAAPVGRVIIGPETYRLTRHAFGFTELAPIEAKGKRDPVPAWLVEAPIVAPAERPVSATPLVGRDREQLLIRTVWDRVVSGSHPHLVTLLGPAGIGKSRLALEIASEVEAEGARVLWGRSLPYEEQTPYRAAGQIVRRAAGIFENDPVEAARGKLASLVGSLFPAAEAPETTRYLSLLLGLGVDLPASDVIHLQFATRRLVERLADTEPLVLVFEDIHWGDDALLDLVDYLARHVRDHRILFLALARPEFLESRPTWGAGTTGTTTLPLDPLTLDESSTVIASLLAHAAGSTVERLVATAEGNPLFIEELVASLLEDPASDELPGTVRAAISARIDALPPTARTALLHASVIGQTFWRDVLANIGELPDVDDALEALESRGLVHRRPVSQVDGDAEFAFKHVLIRDTAYGTLPRAMRRDLHAATAGFLERSVDDPSEIAWILAHHWREGGEAGKAIEYLFAAAERTADALAVEETYELYTRALNLAVTPEERRRIQLRRGIAMTQLEDYGRASRELWALIPELDGIDEIEALLSCGWATIWVEQTDQAFTIANLAIERSAAFGDPQYVPPAQALLSAAHGMRGDEGDLARALEIGSEALAAWVPGARAQDLVQHQQFACDHAYWAGYYDDTLERSRRVKEIAGVDPHSAEFLLRGAGLEGLALAGLGRYEEALAKADAAIATAEAIGRAANVVTNYSTGPLRDIFALAEARRRSAEVAGRLGPSDFNMPWLNARTDLICSDLLLGELGDVERAWPGIWDDALASQAWERWLVSGRLGSLRAELALAMSRFDDAVTWGRQALEMATKGGRAKYEVVSLISLGTALTGTGARDDSFEILERAVLKADGLGSPLYRWRSRAALVEAVRAGSGGAAGIARAETVGAEAEALIRDVAAGLAEERATAYLAAEPVARALERLRQI
jgi:class 3 adenylate cyclase/tetratricopeptide (TPR) repeat protein